MRLPVIQGIIKRRILVNFRADADTVQRLLPKGFSPKIYREKAIVGICLIRLEHIRPKSMPEFIGLASENAAHRIAVIWDDESGKTQEGVYIPRRDTDSFINSNLGGKLFAGEYQRAEFEIEETETSIDFEMKSDDGKVFIKLKGKTSESLPENSIFASLKDSSSFFEKGSLGYSVTKNAKRLDGVVLATKKWEVKPLEIDFVKSSFYEDKTRFPKGSIKFDHALLMQNIEHEWHSTASFELK